MFLQKFKISHVDRWHFLIFFALIFFALISFALISFALLCFACFARTSKLPLPRHWQLCLPPHRRETD